MPVPYLDLGCLRRRLGSAIEGRWRSVLDDTSLVLGPEVREFEAAFAAFTGAAGCVAVANGTLGCFGDGGAVTGPDPALLDRVRLLANHGQDRRYHHLVVGTNSRLDSLQAAVLDVRLGDLAADNDRRRQIPEPLNRQPAFAGHPQSEERLPVAGAAAAELLCLPCFPELTDAEVDEVCAAVVDFFTAR
jgi:dTDP-4-amino-4,6-dideoxygalactose transaminase